MDTPTEDSVRGAAAAFGLPLLLKSKKLAYDGRGNYVVKSLDDIPNAFRKLGARDLYAEKFVPFVKEIAVMVARSINGAIVAHPVVETIHEDNILHLVYAPAPISPTQTESARNLALKAVASFTGAGIFGVEMFLTADGSVLVNEIAPRPHNSGHYTIEACNTSQFEQHLRAITGLPLGDTSLKVPAACMYNVLGSADGKMETTMAAVNRAASTPGATIHWYGKKDVKPQRKMGHITVTANSASVAQQNVDLIRGVAASGAQPEQSPIVAVIMGSDSDLPKMKAACEILRDFGVAFEVRIISAHRTPEYMVQYAKSAHTRGIKVIVAAAGGAAHLPGMVASLTPLPVVGVPINITALAGQDAMLSILQMPRGVPVATVAIDNSTNGALLAIRIIAASEPALLEKMVKYQSDMETMIRKKDTELVEKGYDKFLSSK
jgi:phosphoribosylaminoimidazole carboxylase